MSQGLKETKLVILKRIRDQRLISIDRARAKRSMKVEGQLE